MLIGKNWKIESDSLNITLYKKFIHKKSSKECWRPEAYFSSIKNALHYLMELEVRLTGMEDFKAVSTKIDELHRLVECLPEATRRRTEATKSKTGNLALMGG